MKTTRALASCVLVLSLVGTANGQPADVRVQVSTPSEPYFPPSEANGGWRSFVVPNQEPEHDVKQAIREQAGIDWDRLHAAWQWDLEHVGQGQKCLLVIRRGWIVGEWYHSRKPTDYIHVASAGKSFVGVCMTRLFSHNGMSPDDFVYQFMPNEWSETDPARKKIRIKHVLTMTSGLEPYNGPYESDTYLGVITSLRAQSEPGTVWAYSTGPMDLMNLVIERKTGKGLGDFLNDEILARIGAKPIPPQHRQPFGPAPGRYAMCSKFRVIPRDWARLGYLLLHEGRWNDEQLITPENVRLMASWPEWLGDATVDDVWKWGFQDENRAYAYSFWLNNHQDLVGFPTDAYMARGGAHRLVICPSCDLVIVRIGNYTEGDKVVGHFFELINDAIMPDNRSE